MINLRLKKKIRKNFRESPDKEQKEATDYTTRVSGENWYTFFKKSFIIFLRGACCLLITK